jgi:hypothetical protein
MGLSKSSSDKSDSGNLTSIVWLVKEKYPTRGKKQKKCKFLRGNRKFGKIPSCHSRPCFRSGKLVPAKAGSGNPLEIFVNICETASAPLEVRRQFLTGSEKFFIEKASSYGNFH